MLALKRAGFVQPVLDVGQPEAYLRLPHEHTEGTVSIRRVNVLSGNTTQAIYPQNERIQTGIAGNQYSAACAYGMSSISMHCVGAQPSASAIAFRW